MSPCAGSAVNVTVPVPAELKVKVFEPLVIDIVVLANGGDENVPVAFAAVPLVVIVKVFDPFVTVIEPEDKGEPEKLPVWCAATPGPRSMLQSRFTAFNFDCWA